ncbi:MAG: flagellar biosynthetic protein FliR [Candidatus Puniceispirillales bacterium]|jgi:flagellar biosynthetic protein FliR|nr:flagellar biosynthetic protein FliR [Alphaproteobacteria bacterium]MBL6851302.1 flagellar biosynthetic protein FliR [Alphaproteobacteria bacterium]
MNATDLSLPGIDLFNLYQYLVIFFIASLRISSFLISAPFFSLGGIPLQVRIVAGISLTAFLFPVIKVPDLQTMPGFNLFLIILSEIGIGLSVGLVLTIIFSAAAVAGEKIASTAGLSMSSMIDPQSGGQTLVLSTVLILFLISCFLSLDGHLFIIKMLMESYVYLPIGLSINFLQASNIAIETFGDMLYLAALISLPVVGGLLLIQASIGVITRSAPSLNLFSFGFPIALIAVFVFLYAGVGPISDAFSDLTGTAINLIEEVLQSFQKRN